MEGAYAALGGNPGIPSSRLHFFPNLESSGGAAVASTPRAMLRQWRSPTALPLLCEGSGGKGVGGGGGAGRRRVWSGWGGK